MGNGGKDALLGMTPAEKPGGSSDAGVFAQHPLLPAVNTLEVRIVGAGAVWRSGVAPGPFQAVNHAGPARFELAGRGTLITEPARIR